MQFTLEPHHNVSSATFSARPVARVAAPANAPYVRAFVNTALPPRATINEAVTRKFHSAHVATR